MALGSLATERRKELGAFYTPPQLVTALTDWAVRSSEDRILEPAAGEAVFLVSALRRLRTLGATNPGSKVLGAEIDRQAWWAAREVLRREQEWCEIRHSDFFDLTPEATGLFDLEGRSYGGGVLKLETREAERAELPVLSSKLARELGHALTSVDLALRANRAAQAAELVDSILVRNGLAASSQIAAIRTSHLELQQRRATRGRTKPYHERNQFV